GCEKMTGANERAIDEAGEVAGNEHEELGGIAESVIAHRQPGNDVVRNVIEENHPQPDAAQDIEPQVTLDWTQQGSIILCRHDALHFTLKADDTSARARSGQAVAEVIPCRLN